MISWERVNELRDEVGEEDFAEVIALFLEEVDGVVARLGTAPDPSTLAEDMHFLKGSALNLGFSALSDKCREFELAAETGNSAAVDLTKVFAIYDSSKAAFFENQQTTAAQ